MRRRSAGRLSLVSFCFLVLLVLFPAVAFAEASPHKPILKIESAEFNFGSVSQGSVVEHDFILKNEGTASLMIQRLVPACGCTASTVEKDKIPAGESGKINVKFDTAGFSGEKLKTVRVYSNDLDSPATVLTLKGVVEPDVIVEPKRVYFGDVIRGKASSNKQRIVISVQEGAKASIGQIKSYSKWIELKELSANDRKKDIEVSLIDDVGIGELRERIIVGVKGTKQKSINIPVFASVKGVLKVEPATLSFGVLEGQAGLIRKAKLENLGGSPVKILDIKSSDPAVSASFKEISSGKLFVISVEVDPTRVKKDLRAALRVVTDHGEQREVPLNVYGVLPPTL